MIVSPDFWIVVQASKIDDETHVLINIVLACVPDFTFRASGDHCDRTLESKGLFDRCSNVFEFRDVIDSDVVAA